MKTKLLVLMGIILLQVNVFANQKGNGGDADEILFHAIGSEIQKYLSTPEGRSILQEIDAAQFENVLNDTKVTVTDDDVRDNTGASRTAINQPENKKIFVNRARFDAIKSSATVVVPLVFHEFLGIMGAEVGHYGSSSKVQPASPAILESATKSISNLFYFLTGELKRPIILYKSSVKFDDHDVLIYGRVAVPYLFSTDSLKGAVVPLDAEMKGSFELEYDEPHRHYHYTFDSLEAQGQEVSFKIRDQWSTYKPGTAGSSGLGIEFYENFKAFVYSFSQPLFDLQKLGYQNLTGLADRVLVNREGKLYSIFSVPTFGGSAELRTGTKAIKVNWVGWNTKTNHIAVATLASWCQTIRDCPNELETTGGKFFKFGVGDVRFNDSGKVIEGTLADGYFVEVDGKKVEISSRTLILDETGRTVSPISLVAFNLDVKVGNVSVLAPNSVGEEKNRIALQICKDKGYTDFDSEYGLQEDVVHFDGPRTFYDYDSKKFVTLHSTTATIVKSIDCGFKKYIHVNDILN